MKKLFTKKNIVGVGIFAGVFALTSFEAYKLTPAKTIKSEKTFNKIDEPTDDGNVSYFNQFAAKMASVVDSGNDESIGLSGTFNEFTVTYPSKDGLSDNVIEIDGGLNIIMRALDDMDLNLDLTVSYNDKPIDLAFGLVEQDVYLALNDLRIKSTYSSSMDLLNYIYDCFFDDENEDGLGLDFDLQQVIGALFGNIDMGSLDLSAISATETEVGENVVINIQIKEIAIEITVRKEDLALRKVDLGELNLGNVSICGSIDFDTTTKVLKLDDPLYPKQRGEFVEAISYIGWVDDLLDLFQTKTLGLDLNADISLIDGDEKSLLADISSKIDLNCANVFDFNNLDILEVIDDISNDTFEITDLFNLDNLEFGAYLETKGQKDEVYANIGLSYFEQAAYIALNETDDDAVMKAKISNSTLSELLDTVPNLVDAIGNLKTSNKTEEEIAEASDDMFEFVTSSPFVKGVKNNDFSGIIDMIKNISNDNEKIYVDIDLSSLGLGNDAEVNLVLNSSREEGQKIITLDVSNVVLSTVEINLSLASSEFNPVRINDVKAKRETFDDLSFVPGIINQATNLLNDKRGKLSLDGSILDENNEGVVITGAAQFDANEKAGYGSINLRQYSSKIVNANKYIDHTIDFDVDNSGDVAANKNALFVYNTDLKAKVTIQTFKDIIDLGKDLLNSDDARFTKIKDKLSEMLLTGAINEIIEDKDYLLLAKASFIKSIKQENSGNTIRVIISGDLIGMNNDINICVNLDDSSGEKHLSGLSVSGIEFSGKTVELNVGIHDFDKEFVSKVNRADNFMDFSQVKVLLDFGINTTKINYYHLKANAVVKLSVLSAVNVDLDFHVHVDGKRTRVYGSIPKVPWVTDIASDHLAWDNVNSEFVFEPDENEDEFGGTFHIVKNKDVGIGKDTVTYYQSDSDNFLENIIQYLICDMLNIKSSISDSITDSTVSTEKSTDPDYAHMFTDTGFQYSKDASTGVNTWDIGIALGKILGNDTLGDLELTLKGHDLEKSGIFDSAKVSLGIASILTISADITLDNPSFEVETWPSDIETKYNKVLSWYNNLSAEEKANFDANYKNKPLSGYKMVEKRNYF